MAALVSLTQASPTAIFTGLQTWLSSLRANSFDPAEGLQESCRQGELGMGGFGSQRFAWAASH